MGTRTDNRLEILGRDECLDAATFERVRRLDVDPWVGGEKAHWMRLVPDRVTGRRLAGPG